MTRHRPKPPPPPAPSPSFEAQVEANRVRVLELESRGYLESSICAVTRLPYRVVQHILTTKAAPKKGRKS